MNTNASEIEINKSDITYFATKATLNTKATKIENQTPETTSFICTPEFNKLSKISIDGRIEEVAKSFDGSQS